MNDHKKVITRFAPSPTGNLHVGGVRTALYSYLYARQHVGEMVLRIEDTDKNRSKKEFEDNIIESLSWLGIPYTGPFKQSDRTEKYSEYIQSMLDTGKAYVSKEEPKEEGQRSEVIRFKNPNKVITFEDLVRGSIEFDTTDLGDFVIAKAIDEPLYHLTVVVDDYEMGITHVIRAEEHISNTPRQILIQEAIGAYRPVYAHIPLILAPDRSKLSKRHGATSLSEFKAMGYLPEALLNYLALLGWNPGTEQEIFTLEELSEAFNLLKVQKGGAIFSLEKLNWVNKKHIEKIDDATLAEHLLQYIPESITALPKYSLEHLVKIMPIIKERINTFADIQDMAGQGDLEYFFEKPGYFTDSLLWKNEKSKENTAEYLTYVTSKLEHISEESFTAEIIKEAIWSYAEEKGRGNVLWPMRYSLSGMDRSPDPFTLSEVLGKHETLSRIEEAIKKLREQ